MSIHFFSKSLRQASGRGPRGAAGEVDAHVRPGVDFMSFRFGRKDFGLFLNPKIKHNILSYSEIYMDKIVFFIMK
jgi:hypothetical protein